MIRSFDSCQQQRFLLGATSKATAVKALSVAATTVAHISTLRQAKEEAARCLNCIDAPCSRACPASINPARFLAQLQRDNPHGAAETLARNNALGGTCGAVCPVRDLCEGACRRGQLDNGERPVAIGALQEFLHRWSVQEQQQNEGSIRPPASWRDSPLSSSSTKNTTSSGDTALPTACVVGSGPAGLSAARELARLGFAVTVYEARTEPGGALRYFLSPDRYDRDLLKTEIESLKRDFGVRIFCELEVKDIGKLQEEFDHVVVTTGLQHGKKLPHLPLAVSALDFLESSNTETSLLALDLAKDKHVVVLGGGSVAMDAAITARALGAKNVTVVFPESLSDMPANVDEVALAQHEYCVTLLPQCTVEEWDKDASKLQIRNIIQEDEHMTLHADSVIVAIGQDHSESQKAITEQNGVYFAGDVGNGGRTVVQAVAEGKQVAERISLSTTGRTLASLERAVRQDEEKALEIDFCGITFQNPFCLSSSPVTNTAEMCANAFDAGWAGVVYKTLNLEKDQQILHPSPRLSAVHSPTSRMGIGIQNVEQISDRSLADNLADIAWIKQHYPSNVLGVSVMGFSDDGWKTLARSAEDHGADFVELNFSCPQMHNEAGGYKVGQDADLIERFTAAAKSACTIPVVAKMTPNLTDMVPLALAAQQGGADAVSAVNTFKSISHVDTDYSSSQQDGPPSYRPQPNIQGMSSISGFSGPACRPLALRFIAEMAQDPRLTIPISGMGGITTWSDAVEFLSLGASNLQVTTAVMHHGIDIVDDLKDGLLRHLRRLGQNSVSDIVGASLPYLQSPEKLDLSTEAFSTVVPELCIGCGACVTSCKYGAADAIEMRDGVAHVDAEKCVGCLLCAHVCPIQGAISISTRARIDRN